MGLSFDDEDFFKESDVSLTFNNPPSDPDSFQEEGSMPSQERNEDICDNSPSDPDIILEVRRVPVGRSNTGDE
jgi:hypothetical protein